MKDKVINKPMQYTVVVHDDLNNETTVVAKFKYLGDAILYKTNGNNDMVRVNNQYVKFEIIEGKLPKLIKA